MGTQKPIGECGYEELPLLAGLAYLEQGEGPARNVRALLFCAQQSFTYHVTMASTSTVKPPGALT